VLRAVSRAAVPSDTYSTCRVVGKEVVAVGCAVVDKVRDAGFEHREVVNR